MTALSLQNGAPRGAGLLNPAIYDNATPACSPTSRVRRTTRASSAPTSPTGSTRPAGMLYSVRTFNQDSSLHTNPGWDDVTGVGSPNPNWLDVFSAS